MMNGRGISYIQVLLVRIDVESIRDFEFAFVRIVRPSLPLSLGTASLPSLRSPSIPCLDSAGHPLLCILCHGHGAWRDEQPQSGWDSLQQSAIRGEAKAAGTVGSLVTLLACVSSL